MPNSVNPQIGDIYIQAYNLDGAKVATYMTTSTLPVRDVGYMTGFLELERATRRGTEIPPHAIGGLVVMSGNVSLRSLWLYWLSERKLAKQNVKVESARVRLAVKS